MSLSSSSLQSSRTLSDPCWGTGVLFYSCVILVVKGCVLVGELGERSGLWSKEPELSHVVF